MLICLLGWVLCRDYLKECVEDSIISNASEEALARARFCLASLYMEQNLHAEEAASLRKEAMDILGRYHSGFNDDDVDGIMVLLDDLQPVSGGRFTVLSWLESYHRRSTG